MIFALSVSGWPEHTLVLPVIEMVGVTVPVTVIVSPLETTCVGDAHVALEVRRQVTIAPLVSVAVVKLELLVPAFAPFTSHWYAGLAPPLVMVAVKVVDADVQIVVVGVVMCIVGVTVGLTVIVIPFDVDVAGDTQLPVGVMIQVTTLPLASDDEV